MLPPDTFLQGRYHILHQIGGGGMGTVYLAEDARLPGRHCAIKEVSPAYLPPHERDWAVSAFRREAQILAGLEHPGLTAVIDFFEDGGNWYLVMELIEGETLEVRLRRMPGSRLPATDALDIMRQLCDVLEYLHSQPSPVVFRDLKPSNVMFTPQGQVKLIDFGIARFFKPGQTQDTAYLGTPGYAAPEQYGKGQTDQRSDIYSLGVVLHQMLTGHDPALTPFNLPPAQTLNPQISPKVDAVIQQATQIQVHQRFQNIREMR
jgi:serine/threonine-protein kinase